MDGQVLAKENCLLIHILAALILVTLVYLFIFFYMNGALWLIFLFFGKIGAPFSINHFFISFFFLYFCIMAFNEHTRMEGNGCRQFIVLRVNYKRDIGLRASLFLHLCLYWLTPTVHRSCFSFEALPINLSQHIFFFFDDLYKLLLKKLTIGLRPSLFLHVCCSGWHPLFIVLAFLLNLSQHILCFLYDLYIICSWRN